MFDLMLMEELQATRDPRRQGLFPIADEDPGCDVEDALLMAMQFPRTGAFKLAHARYDRVCVVAEVKDRQRLLELVAKVLWPMIEAGRVFECHPPYAREQERPVATTDVVPPDPMQPRGASSAPGPS